MKYFDNTQLSKQNQHSIFSLVILEKKTKVQYNFETFQNNKKKKTVETRM